MAEALLAVMLVAVSLYTVLAGADFGAGIIEGTMDRKGRERIDVALAPVWEANHVWLVLVVVLLFAGFPGFYARISVHLHIPIVLALLGIVARGSAFTFRHYDPSAAFDRWYSVVFRVASWLAPISLGLALAATAAGRFPEQLAGDFYALYVAPWNTLFGWATAGFVCALFAFEGAALLAAEHAHDFGPLPYLRMARRAHFLAVATGALVLLVAWLDDLAWLNQLAHSALALGAMALATLLIFVVAFAFHEGMPWLLRVALGAQMCCVQLGFVFAQYPFMLRTRSGGVSYRALAAPESTLRALLWAVAIGLAIVLPALWYLIVVHKRSGGVASRGSTRV